MLSRPQMEQIIIQGGSVSIGGRVISRVQDLPSEASLASDNPKALKALSKDIDKQIAALQKQKQQIEQALKPADPSGTAPAGSAPPATDTPPPSEEAA
jgi:hypothetical protein